MMMDLNGQTLKLKMARDCERHDKSLDVASCTVLIHQEDHPESCPKLQSIQQCRQAYLRKGYDIVNEKFDEEISFLYTWP
jgi:predicted GNAT superfamily acetyltransferase